MNITPITLREARTFIRANHRHRPDLVGGLFAIAVASDVVHGVAVVGRPAGRGGAPARIGPALRSVDEVIADRDREVPA